MSVTGHLCVGGIAHRQSQGHQPILGVRELMYVEEGGWRFPLSVSHGHMAQHEQQFEKMWLAGFTGLRHPSHWTVLCDRVVGENWPKLGESMREEKEKI